MILFQKKSIDQLLTKPQLTSGAAIGGKSANPLKYEGIDHGFLGIKSPAGNQKHTIISKTKFSEH